MQPSIGNKLFSVLFNCLKLLKFCPPLVDQTVPWSSDRRVRRAPVEKIRCDMELQVATLRLAVTELLAPHPDGSMSGNITLVKRAAELCSYQAVAVDFNPSNLLGSREVKQIAPSLTYSSLSFEANR